MYFVLGLTLSRAVDRVTKVGELSSFLSADNKAQTKTIAKAIPLDTTTMQNNKYSHFSSDLPECENATIPSDLFVPIFILNRDRLLSLQQSIESYYQTLKSPFEIIILDHQSTYPPTLEYMQHLRDERNVTVISLTDPDFATLLESCKQIIQTYLQEHPDVEYYVFTDADIALLRTRHDLLLFLAANLAACPQIKQVGPHLQVSDIPLHYENHKGVVIQHAPLWKSIPNVATWEGIGYHVVRRKIDTTFAMRRRGDPFARLSKPSLRTYAPFAAVHVDWYYNSSNLPPDKIWYTQRMNEDINHWR